MAIHEQGYRHWEGTYTGHSFRWWSITKAALRSTVYTKGRLFLMLTLATVAWIMPFFFGVFYFFGEIVSSFDLRRSSPDELLRENLYQMLINWQWMWGVIFSAVVGSRLVSNDLRSEALYIYLAKPIRRLDYMIGKVLACVIWIIPVTLAPAIWVYAAASGSSNKLLKLDEPNEIFFELFAVYGTFALVCAACAVAISSFTKRWTLALIGWIGGVFIPIPIAEITSGASRDPEWLYLSPAHNLWIFAQHMWEQQVDRQFTPDWAPAMWILFGLALVGLAVFAVRIARIEVAE